MKIILILTLILAPAVSNLVAQQATEPQKVAAWSYPSESSFDEALQAIFSDGRFAKGAYQEYVEVRSQNSPGLDLRISTPAEQVSAYRPRDRKHVMSATDYLPFSRDFDYQLSGTARPHRSGKIFEVAVPVR